MPTVATADELNRSPQTWNVSLWIVQCVLAVLFGVAGLMKITAPMQELIAAMGWPGAVPPGLVRFIGVAEFLGALGLILPAASRVMPQLTPLSALGLFTIMVLATGFHITRNELRMLPVTLALGALAAFVAWGRYRKAPIPPRPIDTPATPRRL